MLFKISTNFFPPCISKTQGMLLVKFPNAVLPLMVAHCFAGLFMQNFFGMYTIVQEIISKRFPHIC